MGKAQIVATAVATALSAASVALACTTPVYRYALDRWPPDVFSLTVFTDGELTGAESDAVARLRKAGNGPAPLNLSVATVDVGGPMNEETATYYATLGTQALPIAVLRFPDGQANGCVVWTGRPTMEVAEGMLTSDAREQLAQRLLAGDDDVWVLRESGDRAKDKAAVDTLAALDIRPVRVPRDDPAESILLAILTRTEADLAEYQDQPMAFPVFGQGRVLYALVGRGITANNVREAVQFLTGPCACEVKELNPGVDLLMAANWGDADPGDFEAPDEPLPPLTRVTPSLPTESIEDVAALMAAEPGGTTQAIDTAALAQAPATLPTGAPVETSRSLMGRALLGLLLLAAVVLGASVFFLPGKRVN